MDFQTRAANFGCSIMSVVDGFYLLVSDKNPAPSSEWVLVMEDGTPLRRHAGIWAVDALLRTWEEDAAR